MPSMQFPRRRPVSGPCPAGPVPSPLGMLFLLLRGIRVRVHMHIITMEPLCQSRWSVSHTVCVLQDTDGPARIPVPARQRPCASIEQITPNRAMEALGPFPCPIRSGRHVSARSQCLSTTDWTVSISLNRSANSRIGRRASDRQQQDFLLQVFASYVQLLRRLTSQSLSRLSATNDWTFGGPICSAMCSVPRE